MIALTADSFETVVMQESSRPVLVDFYAPWCGPCVGVKKAIDEIQADHFECPDVAFVKINIDDYPDVAKRFGVRALPTLLLFKEGKVVASKVGGLTKRTIEKFLSDFA